MALFDKLKDLFPKSGPGGDLGKYLKMAEEDPSDMRVKLKVGELYFKKKEIEKGIETFKEVAEKYTEDGFNLKAIAIYKNILKVSPGSVEFNERLAELFNKMAIPQDAMMQYRIVINYYQTHNMKDAALSASRAMVEVDPENIENRKQLAELLQSMGESDEALREYENIAKQLRKEMKRIDLLADIYEKILLKKPNEKALLRELCVFYLKLREPKKTLRKIEKFQLEEDKNFKPIFDKARQMQYAMEKAEEDD